jgi:hypothetical protein
MVVVQLPPSAVGRPKVRNQLVGSIEGSHRCICRATPGRAIGNVLPADDGEALGRGLIDGRVDAAEPASDTAGRLLRL